MIDLIVLGAGGGIPTPSRGPAAYWVALDGRGVLMDPGPGALVRLMRHRAGPGSLDGVRTVLVSHLHLDHCADLAPLLFALHSRVLAGTAPLELIGPVGLGDHLEALRRLWDPYLTPARRELVVREVAAGQSLLAPADEGLWRPGDPGAGRAGLRVHAAAHSERIGPALCFRFHDAGGRTLAYSGDSEPCPGLLEAARGADLLLVECSTPDEWELAGHMSPRRVAGLCAEARPREVLLTHIYPPAAALDLPSRVRAHGWRGRVRTARDGTRRRLT